MYVSDTNMFLRCKICRRRGEGIAKEDFASLVTILFSNTFVKAFRSWNVVKLTLSQK